MSEGEVVAKNGPVVVEAHEVATYQVPSKYFQ
jgi:hypothetical protein